MTVGAVAALTAFGIGLFATKPAIVRSLELGAQIAQAGPDADPALGQELGAIQTRGRTLAKWNLGLVALAAAAMATGRYW
jgi:hypothetical protein